MVAKALAEILEEFNDIEDRTERFDLLFDLAEEVEALPHEEWTEQNRVRGCQSQAHIEVRIDTPKKQHRQRQVRQQILVRPVREPVRVQR